MSKKISLGMSLALILISITATFAITMSLARDIYSRLIPDLESRIQQNRALEDLAQKVSQNYYWYNKVDATKLAAALSDGYLRGLGDPYSCYMNAQDYKLYTDRMTGKRQGVGVAVIFSQEAGQLQITQVYPGSPAEKSGLKKGDVLVKIGGTAVTAQNHGQLREQLEGSLLTGVDLTYTRAAAKAGDPPTEKTVTVMHGYDHPTVSSEQIGELAYIKISAFYQNSVTDFKNAVDSAAKRNVRAIIFDLRGTGQGDVAYCAEMLDYIVPLPSEGRKALAMLVRQDGSAYKTFSSDAAGVNLPMAVLVNGKTAGAAELFACDLRDFEKAQLIGDKTAGNASYQADFRLLEGGAILLTVAMVQPYKSALYHEIGLQPDIPVSLSAQQSENPELVPHNEDSQLQTAISLFVQESSKE